MGNGLLVEAGAAPAGSLDLRITMPEIAKLTVGDGCLGARSPKRRLHSGKAG